LQRYTIFHFFKILLGFKCICVPVKKFKIFENHFFLPKKNNIFEYVITHSGFSKIIFKHLIVGF